MIQNIYSNFVQEKRGIKYLIFNKIYTCPQAVKLARIFIEVVASAIFTYQMFEEDLQTKLIAMVFIISPFLTMYYYLANYYWSGGVLSHFYAKN